MALLFFLQTPNRQKEWKAIAKLFHDRWNLPHVIGVVDGKHICIKKPRNAGTLYYNYKHFHYIVLFALVDADYKFVYVDVGAEGQASDSTLWKYSQFHKDIQHKDNPLNVPPPEPFPGYPGDLAYYFIGDDAFEMSLNLMKPYPTTKLTLKQRIGNFLSSRCRCVAENAFGIVSTRLRILRREIEMEPENASIVVLACVVLHNYLHTEAPHQYLPREAADWEGKDYSQQKGVWRDEAAMAGGEPTKSRNRSQKIKDMRDNLANWCIQKVGELAWQYDVVLRLDFYFDR